MRPCPGVAMALPSGRAFYTRERQVWMEPAATVAGRRGRRCLLQDAIPGDRMTANGMARPCTAA